MEEKRISKKLVLVFVFLLGFFPFVRTRISTIVIRPNLDLWISRIFFPTLIFFSCHEFSDFFSAVSCSSFSCSSFLVLNADCCSCRSDTELVTDQLLLALGSVTLKNKRRGKLVVVVVEDETLAPKMSSIGRGERDK